MEDTERLKKEVEELLTGERKSTTEIKKIIFDDKAKQYVIKIPMKLALGAKLTSKSEIKLVINPTEKDYDEAYRSHFIIYGKEEEKHTA